MTRTYRGLILASLGLVAVVALFGSARSDGQWFGKKSTMRTFVEGTEWYKKGDYEKAKDCFDQVMQKNNLAPALRNDLVRWIEFNDVARAGRQRFEETLAKYETAMAQKRLGAARTYLKELADNPYGSAAQKERMRAIQVGGPRLQPPPAVQKVGAKKKDNPMRYIDAHVHVWTADHATYPLAAGFKKEDIRPASFTPEDLLKHARAAGVGRIALIQISSYGFDNSYMLDVIARQPDVFAGTALIDPYDDPIKVMTTMAKQGIRAFRLRPNLSKEPIARWLRPEGFERMFTAGACNHQAMSFLIDPDGLPEVDRMCAAHPNTPVIIDHLARIGADGVIRDRDVDALCALARHRNVMVKVGAFYALGKKTAPYTDLGPMIEKVVKAFGANRCMWESDCPFQVENGHTYQDSIELIRTHLAFLSDADREWLLGKTAERFFFAK